MKTLLGKSILEAYDQLESFGFKLFKRRGLHKGPDGLYISKIKCTAEIFRKKMDDHNIYVTLFYDEASRFKKDYEKYGAVSSGKLNVMGIHIWRGKNCKIEELPGLFMFNPLLKKTFADNSQQKRRWHWGWIDNTIKSNNPHRTEISMRKIELEKPRFQRN